MAWLLRRPLVIHEQNSVAGLTNRVLARFAARVLAAFPSAFGDKASLVGNPVRADIAAIPLPAERFAGRTGKLRLLVVGGSLGAQALNEIVPQALALLPVASRPRVIHQAGTRHIEALIEHYQKAGVEAETRAFIEDMADMYAWCDLVICRAGATTLAEITACGKAAVLVPFPHAAHNHQEINARALEKAGGARVLLDRELSGESLAQAVTEFLQNPDRLAAASERSRSQGKPEAAMTTVPQRSARYSAFSA